MALPTSTFTLTGRAKGMRRNVRITLKGRYKEIVINNDKNPSAVFLTEPHLGFDRYSAFLVSI